MNPPKKLLIVVAMLAGVMSFAPMAAADTVHVDASTPTFSPASVVANAGDVIHWHSVLGIHTVTSGTGSTDPAVGTHFDMALPSNGDVYWTAPSSHSTITYPYFCRPHEIANMKGEIIVNADPAAMPMLSNSGILALIGLILVVGLATFYWRRRPAPAGVAID